MPNADDRELRLAVSASLRARAYGRRPSPPPDQRWMRATAMRLDVGTFASGLRPSAASSRVGVPAGTL